MRLFVLLAVAAQAQLLDQVFSSSLTPEQNEALGPAATLEQKAAAMNPEQRAAANGQLAAAEGQAKTKIPRK